MKRSSSTHPLCPADAKAELLASRCWFYFSILTAVCVITLAALVASIWSEDRVAPQGRPLIQSSRPVQPGAPVAQSLTRVAGGLLGLTVVLLFALFLGNPPSGPDQWPSAGLADPAAHKLQR